jgi:7-cyano-7-deazaguanine synthase in queuosine biosynthesis
MSKEEDKFKHSKRLLKDENAVKKQVKIAKEHGVPIKDAHKFAKKHAMNCGNPKCILCANPRKTFNELTLQERRMFQDIDKETDKHSNGLKNDE